MLHTDGTEFAFKSLMEFLLGVLAIKKPCTPTDPPHLLCSRAAAFNFIVLDNCLAESKGYSRALNAMGFLQYCDMMHKLLQTFVDSADKDDATRAAALAPLKVHASE